MIDNKLVNKDKYEFLYDQSALPVEELILAAIVPETIDSHVVV
jgi:hypothetical protein